MSIAVGEPTVLNPAPARGAWAEAGASTLGYMRRNRALLVGLLFLLALLLFVVIGRLTVDTEAADDHEEQQRQQEEEADQQGPVAPHVAQGRGSGLGPGAARWRRVQNGRFADGDAHLTTSGR